MFGLTREKSLVGLDIGSHGVKVLELTVRKRGKQDRFEVAKAGYEPLPHDAVVDGAIIDSTAVVGTIKAAFEKAKITSRNVVISIAGNAVIIKKIVLPAMETAELAESIIWEAKHNIPYPYEETNVDYAILRPPDGDTDRGLEILLVAVKKDKVASLSNVISQAKKNLAAIEVDAFALYNALEVNYPEEFARKIVAVVNLGANVSTIVVTERGIPQLFRDLPVGGVYIGEALRKDLGLGWEDAEAVLRGQTPEGAPAEEIAAMIEMNIKSMFDEIEKTLAFYTAEDRQEKRIEAIYLAGGLAVLPNMAAAFEKKFGIPTLPFDPFRKVSYKRKNLNPEYLQEMAPLFGVAVGLATRKREK